MECRLDILLEQTRNSTPETLTWSAHNKGTNFERLPKGTTNRSLGVEMIPSTLANTRPGRTKRRSRFCDHWPRDRLCDWRGRKERPSKSGSPELDLRWRMELEPFVDDLQLTYLSREGGRMWREGGWGRTSGQECTWVLDKSIPRRHKVGVFTLVSESYICQY